jgi:regulator of protease activity HflC (stomatin/prohibitin superfamily)
MNIASVLQGLAVLIWLVFFGLVFITIARASRGRDTRGFMVGLIALAAVGLIVTSLGLSVVFIQPNERGVVISALAPKGYREPALEPGMRFIVPYFEEVRRYPISNQNYTMSIAPNEGEIQGDDSISARTLDGQEIFIDASVIFQIDPTKVIDVHITWQDRYKNELVRAQARGVIRDGVSQYRVEEVVSTKRFEMVNFVREALAAKLSDNGLLLVDFVLRNITFSPEYAASIEQKQIAEQQAQQARLVVEQRRQEAEQARQQAQGLADSAVIRAQGDADARIIQAEAERQALDLIAQALAKNPDLLTYTYINKLAPSIQVMLVPNNAPYLLPLPSLPGPQPAATPVQPSTTP